MSVEIRSGSIEANGLRFGFLETGESGAPLVLCLHGFPGLVMDVAQAPERASAGFASKEVGLELHSVGAIDDSSHFDRHHLARRAGAGVFDAADEEYETAGGDLELPGLELAAEARLNTHP